MDYVIERFSESKIKDLIYIFKAVHPTNAQQVSFFKNKFDTSFAGIKYIGYMAYAPSGEPASFYGVFPCFLTIDGKKILAAQSGDTITHPNHQKKGLFIILAQKTYELARAEGIKLIFGFPNQNSYHGFIKYLKWVHTESFNAYRINVRSFPFLKAVHKFPLLQPLYNTYLKIIDPIFVSKGTVFENSCIENQFGGIIHDQGFFDYKRYDNPQLIRIDKYTLWIKRNQGLMIGDIKPLPDFEFDRLLRLLKRYCFWAGIHNLLFMTSPNTWLDKCFRRTFSSDNGGAIGFCILDNDLKVDLSRFKFNMADSDTF